MDMLRSPAAVPWQFPTKGLHDGIPLGNGLFGALLWGSDNTLHLTINRSDYWHHDVGFVPGEDATYAHLKTWLQGGRTSRIPHVFEGRDEHGDPPPRPTRLPLGRIDLSFPEEMRLSTSSLELATGSAGIVAMGPASASIEAVVPRRGSLLAVRIEGCCYRQVAPVPVPANTPAVKAFYESRGFSPADLRVGTVLSGWTQRRPNDPTVAVACLMDVGSVGSVAIYVAIEYGASSSDAWRRAVEAAEEARDLGYDALADQEAAWWRSFWSHCARVQVDSVEFTKLYNLGMYRLACASAPGSPAMGLQGPWVEDDRVPPWEADYHFNINVQMCHWPALTGNWSPALEPLWHMVTEWMPKMREAARRYIGIDDGFVLPHAVDDRCVAMGGFWPGHIDHASLAWLAHLAWRSYRFSMDKGLLQDVAYPLLRGAMRVYEQMLEEDKDGKLALPVGVSAEWGGRDLDAWGRNPSYQLGMIHALARDIVQAAEALGLNDDIVPRCQDIARRLPLFAAGGTDAPGYWAGGADDDHTEIAIWEGLLPTSSHRHFSHLAGLYPLDLFDVRRDPALGKIVERSMQRLTRAGMGEWCGWSFPWAATLYARLGMGNAAALSLAAFSRAFTTLNGGSMIFPRLEGLTGSGPDDRTMQLDGGMGFVTAMQEMLLHTRSGVLYVFPAVPDEWRSARFVRARAENGFIVSAERRNGAACWIRVLATADAELRLALPFHDGAVSMISSREEDASTWIGTGTIRRHMQEGEEVILTLSSGIDQQ